MSCGFHHAYCKPCQKSRAWRIRRISCRRATIPSWRYSSTSSRSAFTRSGRRSSSRSLFGPSACFASASCALAAGAPSTPSGPRAAPAPEPLLAGVAEPLAASGLNEPLVASPPAAAEPLVVRPPEAAEPSSGAMRPSFGSTVSPFKIEISDKVFIGVITICGVETPVGNGFRRAGLEPGRSGAAQIGFSR
jgi:hypothetical protein